MRHVLPPPSIDHDPLAAATAVGRELPGANPGTIVIQGPKSNLLGRIAGGLLCSATVTVLMYFMQLKTLIIHILAFVVGLFGGNHYKVEKKAENDKPAMSIPAKLTMPLAAMLEQGKDKAKVATEAATQPIKAAAEAAEQKAVKVEKAVVGTKDEAFRKLEAMKEERAKKHAEQAAAERTMLLAKAAELGLNCGEDWPLASLRRDVAAAEQHRLLQVWKKHYNGSCPACRQPMRVSLRGQSDARCPRCGAINTQNRIRSFPPPMPRNFRGF